MLFGSQASRIGAVLVCAWRHCLRRSSLMPLCGLAVRGCTWVLCLTFAADREGHRLIGVILGEDVSSRRFSTAESLLDWGARTTGS